MSDIGLGEAIKALRKELLEARAEGKKSWMRFEVGPVDLELQLVVSKDGRGQVGWKILEAEGSVGSERTQQVRLTLTPQWYDVAKGQWTTDILVAGVLPDTEAGSQDGGVSSLNVPDTDAASEAESQEGDVPLLDVPQTYAVPEEEE